MRYFSHRWLGGPLLALAVLASGFAESFLRAQPPGLGSAPPGAVVPVGAFSPAPPPGGVPATPGLPAGRSAMVSLSRQGDLLRLHRNVPGDAKPILVEADEISTW